MRDWTLAILLLVFVGACSSPECGNGKVEDGEDCDGDSFAPIYKTSCRALGYNGSGDLGCTSGCRLDHTPCEVTGRCGDGVVTHPYEECDGANLDGQTCESLGHHTGVLFCGLDCRLDVTGCQRCGDGVLQESFGELYENGLRTCLDHGFLGGFHQTADCVTPRFETCGDYRLVSLIPGVSRPVVGFDAAQSRIWLSGLVRGTFPGFQSRTGCPRIIPIAEHHSNNCESWEEYFGFYNDPTCDQEFLALIDGNAPTAVLAQADQGGTVVRVIALPDGTTGLVRQVTGASGYTLFWERRELTGFRTTAVRLLEGTVSEPLWTWQVLDDGTVAFTFLEDGALRTVLLDPVGGVLRDGPSASEFELGGVAHGLFTQTSAPLAHWSSTGDVSFVLLLLPSGETAPVWTWVRLQHDGAAWQLTGGLHLAGIPVSSPARALWVEPADETVEVAWASSSPSLDSARWSFTGEPRSSWRHELPVTDALETVHRLAGGGYVLGGYSLAVHAAGQGEVLCSADGGKLFARWLDADGNLTGERLLTAPGLLPVTSVGPPGVELCDLAWRTWAHDAGSLVVGGNHLTDRPFCFDVEPVTTHQDLPLHDCDIHVVRFTPP